MLALIPIISRVGFFACAGSPAVAFDGERCKVRHAFGERRLVSIL